MLLPIPEADARTILAEIRRISRRWALICEKVQPGFETDAHSDPTRFLSRHRPVAQYASWMLPWRLVEVQPRPAPAVWRGNPGALMLFVAPS